MCVKPHVGTRGRIFQTSAHANIGHLRTVWYAAQVQCSDVWGTIIISTATVLVCFGYVQRVGVGMYRRLHCPGGGGLIPVRCSNIHRGEKIALHICQTSAHADQALCQMSAHTSMSSGHTSAHAGPTSRHTLTHSLEQTRWPQELRKHPSFLQKLHVQGRNTINYPTACAINSSPHVWVFKQHLNSTGRFKKLNQKWLQAKIQVLGRAKRPNLYAVHTPRQAPPLIPAET